METTNYTDDTSQVRDASAELSPIDANNTTNFANGQNEDEEIRRRAHEIYESRRAADRAGDELSDWLEAEQLVRFSRGADNAAENQLPS